jgi:hypothetical protein
MTFTPRAMRLVVTVEALEQPGADDTAHDVVPGRGARCMAG